MEGGAGGLSLSVTLFGDRSSQTLTSLHLTMDWSFLLAGWLIK
jgi:hypothetical protein